MFHRLVTKSGDQIWYSSYVPLLGRYEVIRLANAAHERQKIRKSMKLLDLQLETKDT